MPTHKNLPLHNLIATFIVLLTVFLWPNLVGADTILRTGDSVSVASDQVVDGDFYVVTSMGSLSGMINGDLQAIAGVLTANGSVTGDVFIIGGSVQHHATVTDDVRIVGGEVTIAESIGGDLVVVGGTVTVLSTAQIGGDVLFFGGEADINGPVGGSVLGMSERLRIDAQIGEDVEVTTGQLTLGDRAAVDGNISYSSGSDLVRSANAVVAGEVVKNATPVTDASFSSTVVLPYLILMFGSLILYLFFKQSMFRIVSSAIVHPIPSLLIGAATIFITPTLIVFLVTVVLGILLGLLLGGGLVFFYTLATLFAGPVVGGWLFYLYSKKIRVDLISIAVGTTVLYVCLFIPVLNILILIAMFMLTMGAILWHLYHQMFIS